MAATDLFTPTLRSELDAALRSLAAELRAEAGSARSPAERIGAEVAAADVDEARRGLGPLRTLGDAGVLLERLRTRAAIAARCALASDDAHASASMAGSLRGLEAAARILEPHTHLPERGATTPAHPAPTRRTPDPAWPRLTEELDGPRHPARCQRCGSAPTGHNSRGRTDAFPRWQEHDHHDRPEPRVAVLCTACAGAVVEAHPRLYRELGMHDPWPGCMPICIDCPHRAGVRCAHPKLKANGGPGLYLRVPRAAQLFVDHSTPGGRRGELVKTYLEPVRACEGRTAAAPTFGPDPIMAEPESPSAPAWDRADAHKRFFATLRDADVADRAQWQAEHGLPPSTQEWGEAEYVRATEILVAPARRDFLARCTVLGVDPATVAEQVLGHRAPELLREYQRLVSYLNTAAVLGEGLRV